MSNLNDFLPFATASGANVLSPAAWAAAAERLTGWQNGLADATKITTATRQSSFVASMVAQFTADFGPGNVVDNGNLAAFEAQFEAALVAYLTTFFSVKLDAGRLIGVRTFTSSGTYTPAAGMTYGIFEGCGGGGGAAGAINPTAGNLSLGAPGGGATSGKAFFTAATIGASQAVAIGAGGPGGNAANGSVGGATSLGSLLSLPGGTAGAIFNTTGFPAFNGNGSLAGAASGANISSKRGATPGYATAVSALVAGVFCGPGGDTPYGTSVGNSANTNGPNGSGNGAGGAGVAITNGGGPATGGTGAGGILIISEYGF